ncbi:MAG: hypothetical protein ACR2RA_22695 [Geminicoccaceae bacterium]
MATSRLRHPILLSAAILSALMLVLSGCHYHHYGRSHGSPGYHGGGHHGGGHRRGGWRGRH